MKKRFLMAALLTLMCLVMPVSVKGAVLYEENEDGTYTETYIDDSEVNVDMLGMDNPDAALSAPTGVVWSTDTYSVSGKWDAVEGADKYEVYLITEEEVVNIIRTGSTSTTLGHYMERHGSDKYILGVKAFNTTTGEESDFGVVSDYYYYTRPSNQLSKPSNVKWNGTKLSWNAVSGASGYYLTVYADGEIDCYIMLLSSVTSIDISRFVDAGICNVEIKALSKDINTTASSDYTKSSKVLIGDAVVPKPTNVGGSVASSTSNKITWTKANNVDGYIVYRKAAGESKYSYLGLTTSTSYTDSSVTKGTKYTYVVYSYIKNSDGSRTLSAASSSTTVLAGASSVTNLKATGAGNGKVKLTWTKSVGAPTGYIIYRKIGDGKFEYRYMVGSTATSFTDTTASETAYNFYRVYPYITVNGTRVLGPSATYVYAKGTLSAVTNLKAAGVTGGVKLTWTKAEGATGYIIYAKRNGDAAFSYVTLTTAATYTDAKASKTGYNFYRVYPYETISGKRVLGPSVAYVYAKAK